MYMLVLIKKLITTKVENRFASGKKIPSLEVLIFVQHKSLSHPSELRAILLLRAAS